MSPPVQPMRITLQQQLAQAGQNGPGIDAARLQFNIFIWEKVDLTLTNMTPDQIANLLTKASDQLKHIPLWTASNDRDRARLTLFHLYKQKVMLDNARRMQAANSQM